jgi:flagella basal body P-ring formation protein FlgA
MKRTTKSMTKRMTVPGLLAYSAMAMWLLQLAISPAGAAEAMPIVQSRLASHIDAIKTALVENGAPDAAKVTLTNPDQVIALEEGAPLAFDSVSFNPATGRFLMRASTADSAAPLTVTGTAIAALILPVPARPMARGELVSEGDLKWIEIAGARAGLYLEDADAIIGKIARRPLIPGAPLRNADLQSPTLIKRGSTATIVLEAPGIRLTQIGAALANGGAGDLIAFRNINSDREIKAVVIGENLASAPFHSASLASLEQDQ